MRAAGLRVLCLCTLLSWFLADASQAFEDPAARTRVTELENGLRVLTLEDPSTPVVSFQVWVQAGSGDETGYTGLAHLFEHMMFRGSKHVSEQERERLLKERGVRMNAFTSRDVTVYFEDAAAEHLPLLIELEAERFRNLVINAEVLDTEREVVLEERRMRTEDDPQGRVFEALMALTFQAHHYRHPTIGWRSDVEKVPVEVCRDFFDRYYVPQNLVISIAGNFDAEDALARIREHWGPLPEGPPVTRPPALEPAQTGERRAEVLFPVRGPIVAAAWHAPETGNPDAEALDVVSSILSSGRTSRMHRKLVYEEEKALGAYGSYWELHRAGVFFAGAAVRPGEDVAVVEDLLLAEIERLRREPVSEEELAKAKRTLEAGMIRGLGTAHALASRNGSEFVAFGRIRPLEERLVAIRAVTVEDVQRVAETWFAPEGRNVVRLVSPPEASEESGEES